MTPSPSPGPNGSDVDERRIARLLKRYLDGDGSVSDDDLRGGLEAATSGAVVGFDSADTELSVTVERAGTDGGETVRERYVVRYVPNVDGEPALDWSYLGPVE